MGTGIIGYTKDDPPRPILRKDPDAIKDYAVNWKFTASDPFDQAQCTITPDPGLTLEVQTFQGTKQVGWFSGGTIPPGETFIYYNVTFRVVSAGGRVDNKTMVIKVSEA